MTDQNLVGRICDRITTQARNLLFAHRHNLIDKDGKVQRGPHPVSPNDVQLMLESMGRLTAQIVLEEVGACKTCRERIEAQLPRMPDA